MSNTATVIFRMSDGRQFPVEIALPDGVSDVVKPQPSVADVVARPMTCTLDDYDENYIVNQKAEVARKLQQKLTFRTIAQQRARDNQVGINGGPNDITAGDSTVTQIWTCGPQFNTPRGFGVKRADGHVDLIQPIDGSFGSNLTSGGGNDLPGYGLFFSASAQRPVFVYKDASGNQKYVTL